MHKSIEIFVSHRIRRNNLLLFGWDTNMMRCPMKFSFVSVSFILEICFILYNVYIICIKKRENNKTHIYIYVVYFHLLCISKILKIYCVYLHESFTIMVFFLTTILYKCINYHRFLCVCIYLFVCLLFF